MFSVLVNSMPDERTGSKFTWLNSPVRANQDAQTLVDMVRIGQWYGSETVCVHLFYLYYHTTNCSTASPKTTGTLPSSGQVQGHRQGPPSGSLNWHWP